MKSWFKLFLLAGMFALWTSCGSIQPVMPGKHGLATEAAPAEISQKLYDPQQLGITIQTNNGVKSARWKETIALAAPITLPLLPPNRSFSTQPRIAGEIAGIGSMEMVIDTGAPLCVLRTGTNSLPGVKMINPLQMANTFKGLRGEELLHYGVIDELRFGAMNLKGTLAGIYQTTNTFATIDHLLGLSTLGKFAYITIAPREGQVVFSLSQPFEPRTNMVKVPFTFSGMQLLTDLVVNDSFEITVLIDTGNDAKLMLNERTVNDLGLGDAVAGAQTEVYSGLGGATRTKSFRVNKITLGNITMDDVEVVMVPGDFPPSIGSGLLQGFETTYDFRQSCLWLELP